MNSNFCPPTETGVEEKRKKKAEIRPSQNVDAIISIQTASKYMDEIVQKLESDD